MRHYLWLGLLGSLLGCGSGTDVGNPVQTDVESVATRDDFLGTYGPSTIAAASSGSSIAKCTTQSGTTPAINAGTGTTAVLLSGVFNYANITDPIAGTVTNGTLTIDVSGISTRLQCTGTLSFATLTFTCDVTTTNGTSQCTLVLEQQ